MEGHVRDAVRRLDLQDDPQSLDRYKPRSVMGKETLAVDIRTKVVSVRCHCLGENFVTSMQSFTLRQL
jgi:hypothetical protein